MSASLPHVHAQLDVIDRLRANAAQGTPRENIQAICQALYGEPVPEAWLDQAQFETSGESSQPMVSTSTPSPTALPAVVQARLGLRQAMRQVSERPYQRPASVQEWKARKAELEEVLNRYGKIDAITLIGFMAGLASVFLTPLLVACFSELTGPRLVSSLVGSLALCGSMLGWAFSYQKLEKKCSARFKDYKRAKLSGRRKDGKSRTSALARWAKFRETSVLVLSHLDDGSGVPVLRGDVKRLNRLAKKVSRRQRQEQALKQLRASAT